MSSEKELDETSVKRGWSGNLKAALIAGYLAAAIVAIFWLPTLIPVKPSISDSYMFGYNNRAGIALMLCFTFGGALWFRCRPIQHIDCSAVSLGVSQFTLWLILGLALTCCGAMYFLTARFNGFLDSGYFIERIHQAEEGRTIYKNFEFAYGPGLIYGPLMIAHLCRLSVTNAYYLFWSITVLGGIIVLYVTIRLIDFPSGEKGEIFALLSVFSLPATLFTGVNGNYSRFALVPLAAVLSHRAFTSVRETCIPVRAYATVIAFSGLLLLLSPELALSFAVGGSFYLAVHLRPVSFKKMASFLVMLAVIGLIFSLANRSGVLDTLKRFGSGGYNYPILPAPYILTFAGALFLAARYAISRFRSQGRSDSLMFILAASLPMVVGALSRCEPWHAGFGGIGIWLVAAFYGSRTWIWRWCKLAFVLCLIVGPTLSSVWNSRGLLLRATYTSVPQIDPLLIKVAAKAVNNSRTIRDRLDAARLSTENGNHLDLGSLYPHATELLSAPFGFFPDGIGDYLSPRVDFGSNFGLLNVADSEQVDAKIQELRTKKTQLLLPSDFPDSCRFDAQDHRQWIRILFLFPYTAKAKHPENLLQPLCDFIAENYRVVDPASAEHVNYGLWALK